MILKDNEGEVIEQEIAWNGKIWTKKTLSGEKYLKLKTENSIKSKRHWGSKNSFKWLLRMIFKAS